VDTSTRIDSLFLAATKSALAERLSFQFEGSRFEIAGNGKSWPRLSYDSPFRPKQTGTRDFWIKPDCILLSKENGCTKVIVIEVCKSWQNFASKRYQYCDANKGKLMLFEEDGSSLHPSCFSVIYALPSDGEDWMFSRIANMPDCGGRFVEGVEYWAKGLAPDIREIVFRSRNRHDLVEIGLRRPEISRGKAHARRKQDDKYISPFPSLRSKAT
jgi:hypothetical protein